MEARDTVQATQDLRIESGKGFPVITSTELISLASPLPQDLTS
jgi:hypothetical protein